jgi:branched-chain amino acid transport system substrate-binding protein
MESFMKKLLFIFLAFLINISFAEQIVIGVQAPITGAFASEGQGMSNAVHLLVKQVNENGGINGDTFKVITCDDAGNPQGAVVCAGRLIDDGAKVVIGSYSSTATEASQRIYAQANVIQTSDATASALMNNHYPTYFRNSFNDNVEGSFTANYFVKVKKYKRIAILSDFSSFATGLSDSVIKNIKLLNGNIVYTGKINSGNNDFRAVLTKIKSLKPDVIYYSGYFTEGALLRAQQVELNIPADFVGGNSNDNPLFVKIAGNAARGSYLIGLPQPNALKSNIATKFLQDYKQQYNKSIPSIWTITNIDGLLAVFNTMRIIKSNDVTKIAAYIHGNLKHMQGMTGDFTIDANGERVGNIYQVSKINSNLSYSKVY